MVNEINYIEMADTANMDASMIYELLCMNDINVRQTYTMHLDYLLRSLYSREQYEFVEICRALISSGGVFYNNIINKYIQWHLYLAVYDIEDNYNPKYRLCIRSNDKLYALSSIDNIILLEGTFIDDVYISDTKILKTHIII